MAGKPLDYTYLIGQKFNRLTILEIYRHAYETINRKSFTFCKVQCKCKKEFETRLWHGTAGKTKSCGCIGKEYENSALRSVYNNYKSSAKRRKLLFELSYEDIEFITDQQCFYCGTKPYKERCKNGDKYIFNGIDRVDSSKGYVSGNVVPCCEICNCAKKDMPYDDFVIWLRRVSTQWQHR